MTQCAVDECAAPIFARSWCQPHYTRWLKYGEPTGRPTPRTWPNVIRDEHGNKQCCRCLSWRSETSFTKSSRSRDGLVGYCKVCEKEKRDLHKEDHRSWKRLQNFGMTEAEFEALLIQQDGRCAICRTDSPGAKHWCVDHDHRCCPSRPTCGKCVRGILCNTCNRALGLLSDNVDTLLSMVTYLNNSKRWEKGPDTMEARA